MAVTLKKLTKIRRELEHLMASPQGVKPRLLISYAKKLGRVEDNRGKEPTYVRERNPELSPPLTIPNHKGRDMRIGTTLSILEVLLSDVDEWEIFLGGYEGDARV